MTYTMLGLLGSVTAVPSGFTIKYALSYNNTGVNNAMTGAGDRLLTVRTIGVRRSTIRLD